ncbi:general secretion pathway protein F, partial [Achromobacter xylosoxidans C54]
AAGRRAVGHRRAGRKEAYRRHVFRRARRRARRATLFRCPERPAARFPADLPRPDQGRRGLRRPGPHHGTAGRLHRGAQCAALESADRVHLSGHRRGGVDLHRGVPAGLRRAAGGQRLFAGPPGAALDHPRHARRQRLRARLGRLERAGRCAAVRPVAPVAARRGGAARVARAHPAAADDRPLRAG